MSFRNCWTLTRDTCVASQSLVVSSELGMTGAPTVPLNSARSSVSASHRLRNADEEIPSISRWDGNSAVASAVGGYWPGGVLARFVSMLRKVWAKSESPGQAGLSTKTRWRGSDD